MDVTADHEEETGGIVTDGVEECPVETEALHRVSFFNCGTFHPAGLLVSSSIGSLKNPMSINSFEPDHNQKLSFNRQRYLRSSPFWSSVCYCWAFSHQQSIVCGLGEGTGFWAWSLAWP
jgi:hypothetical protein